MGDCFIAHRLPQQRPRSFQVRRVASLAEPAVDFGHYIAELGSFAMLLKKVSETRRGPRFERLRL